MKAAEVAARRGHQVTLYEKGEQLGGRFLLTAIPPKRQVLREDVDYLERQLRKQPVRLALGGAFSASSFAEHKPDALILATGAKAYLPSIEGIGDVPTISPDQMLAPGAVVPENVVVLGGGGIGAEIADYLAEQGKQVTLVEMREGIALDMPPHMQHFLRVRLRERGATVLTHADQGGPVRCWGTCGGSARGLPDLDRVSGGRDLGGQPAENGPNPDCEAGRQRGVCGR